MKQIHPIALLTLIILVAPALPGITGECEMTDRSASSCDAGAPMAACGLPTGEGLASIRAGSATEASQLCPMELFERWRDSGANEGIRNDVSAVASARCLTLVGTDASVLIVGLYGRVRSYRFGPAGIPLRC